MRRTVLIVLVTVFAFASLVTSPRASAGRAQGPLLEGAQVDPAVLGILNRSCRDCHSEQTNYPWYSYVAPVSILIGSDVKRGREHLNFSEWPQYSKIRRERALSEIANQVKDRDMPLTIYLLLHPSARLSSSDVDTVFNWTQQERLRLIMNRQ